MTLHMGAEEARDRAGKRGEQVEMHAGGAGCTAWHGGSVSAGGQQDLAWWQPSSRALERRSRTVTPGNRRW